MNTAAVPGVSRRRAAARFLPWLLMLVCVQLPATQRAETLYPVNPVVADGLLCASGDGLRCFDSASLEKRWTALAELGTFEPLIAANTLLVASTGGLHALNMRDGTRRWQWHGDTHAFPPAVRSGVVFATDRAGGIAALDLDDGREIWQRQLDGWLYTPALLDDRLIIGGSSGVIYGLDGATGDTFWTRELDQELVYRPVAVAGGVVVTTFKGTVLHLDGDGRLIWEVRDSAPSFSPAVAGDLLVFGGMDGVLRARDRDTGRLLWRVELSGSLSVPPRVEAGQVAIASPDGLFVVIDAASGALIARTTVHGTPLGQPIRSDEGVWRVLQREAGIFAWVGAS